MRTPQFLQLHQHDQAGQASEAIAGLLAMPAQVSPKFLYDPLGSRLFEAITVLDEYYPTRTEASILQQHLPAIRSAVQATFGAAGPSALVDLGAGNCAKAASLFAALAPQRYVAVDISVDFLHQALGQLQLQHPTLDMVGVGLDFSADLVLPPGLVTGPALVFYPGSSIGNFQPAQALRLLRQARALAHGGALLIGVDLVKPVEVLEPAYDDGLGVTAAFNLNLLKHLNRLLGSDFEVRDWRHVALFNTAQRRIEMHLEARRTITVRWPGGQRLFAAGERLHTENSYKWRPDDFVALLRDAGFSQISTWTDPQDWFGVLLAEG